VHAMSFFFFFFFSSRRRHTRFSRDWSSDVCSSDLVYSYYTSNYAISTLLLKENRPEKTPALMKRIREGMPNMLRSEPKFGFGGGRDGVQVTLSGQSTDVLKRISNDVVPILSQIEGLTDVQTEMEAGQYELVIQIDRERAHHLGLSSADVARTVA